MQTPIEFQTRLLRLISCGVLASAVPAVLSAQVPVAVGLSASRTVRTAPIVEAVRVPMAPDIDGRIDDAAWLQARVISTFTQRDPNEGQPASEATEVRIVYDDEAIYVAARMED